MEVYTPAQAAVNIQGQAVGLILVLVVDSTLAPVVAYILVQVAAYPVALAVAYTPAQMGVSILVQVAAYPVALAVAYTPALAAECMLTSAKIRTEATYHPGLFSLSISRPTA